MMVLFFSFWHHFLRFIVHVSALYDAAPCNIVSYEVVVYDFVLSNDVAYDTVFHNKVVIDIISYNGVIYDTEIACQN